MIRYVIGKKGDIIITDAGVKRELGIAKHIVVVRAPGNFEEVLRTATPATLAKVLRIVREGKTVVFAEVAGDVELGEERECREESGEHVDVRICRVYKRWLIKGRRLEKITYNVWPRKFDYDESEIEAILAEAEEALKRINRVAESEEEAKEALRLWLLATGRLKDVHCLPLRQRVPSEAVEEAVRLGLPREIAEKELKEWESEKYCVEYPWAWANQNWLPEKTRKLLEMIGLV